MKKKFYFVCVGLLGGDLFGKCIEALTMIGAEEIFKSETNLDSKFTAGPFFKKRGWSYKNEHNITFLGKSKKATYNGRAVRAHLLSSPTNTAMLFFDKMSDNKQTSPSSDNLIVNMGDLKFNE